MDQVKFVLDEAQAPTHWYNIAADLPTPPPPPLHPGTKQPVGPDDLAPLFPPELIAPEVSSEQYIEIGKGFSGLLKLTGCSLHPISNLDEYLIFQFDSFIISRQNLFFVFF